MLAAFSALVAALALQASATQLTVGAYALARHDTTRDGSLLETTAFEVGPLVGLDRDDRVVGYGIAYFPRLLFVVDAPPLQVFHQGSWNVALRPDPTLRLTANVNGCYGTNDFRLQHQATCSPWPGLGWTGGGGMVTFGTGGPVPPGVLPIPQLPKFRYLNATGGLGFESKTSPRVVISGGASYQALGGADAPSRILVPLQRGPSLWAALDWTVVPDDVLTTILSGSYFGFLVDATVPALTLQRTDTWISQASEIWRHALGPRARLRLGIGLGVTGTAADPGRLTARKASPTGEVGVDQAFGQPAVQLGLGARVAPFVDYTSGLAYERGEAFASLAWPPHRDWRLEANVSAAVALEGTQHGQTTGTGRLALTWTVAEVALLSAGLATLWQEAGSAPGASSLREWTVFLGVGFKDVARL